MFCFHMYVQINLSGTFKVTMVALVFHVFLSFVFLVLSLLSFISYLFMEILTIFIPETSNFFDKVSAQFSVSVFTFSVFTDYSLYEPLAFFFGVFIFAFISFHTESSVPIPTLLLSFGHDFLYFTVFLVLKSFNDVSLFNDNFIQTCVFFIFFFYCFFEL